MKHIRLALLALGLSLGAGWAAPADAVDIDGEVTLVVIDHHAVARASGFKSEAYVAVGSVVGDARVRDELTVVVVGGSSYARAKGFKGEACIKIGTVGRGCN